MNPTLATYERHSQSQSQAFCPHFFSKSVCKTQKQKILKLFKAGDSNKKQQQTVSVTKNLNDFDQVSTMSNFC